MDLKMNNRNGGWGTVLITFGLTALIDNFGISEWYKVALLGLGGLVAFFFYFRDRTDWAALIPAYILWAAALITVVVLVDVFKGDIIAVAILPVVAIPFLYVYFRNRQNWWALIPAYVLLLIAVIILVVEIAGLGDDYLAVVLMPGLAAPFLYIYLKNKERWWALIPAYALLLVGLIISLDELLVSGDKFIAPGILGGIGLPFLYVYLRNRDNWWALIPAYALLAIGTLVLLLDFRLLTGLVIPAFIMLAIAIPFFFVYLLNRERKWALIPGAITAVLGLGFLVGTEFGKFATPAVLVLAGIWLLVRVLIKD